MLNLLIILSLTGLSHSFYAIEGPRSPIEVNLGYTFNIFSSKVPCPSCSIVFDIRRNGASEFFRSFGLDTFMAFQNFTANNYFVIEADGKTIDNKTSVIIRFLEKSIHTTFKMKIQTKSFSTKPFSCYIYGSKRPVIDLRVYVPSDSVSLRLGRPRVIRPGMRVSAHCSASHVAPDATLEIRGLNHSRINGTVFNNINKTLEVTFTASKFDHNKTISCHLKDSDIYSGHLLKIEHPPMSLELDPPYRSNVLPGSNFKCFSKSGYPAPLIKWRNLNQENISQNIFRSSSGRLYIDEKAPPGTVLNLRCTAFYSSHDSNSTVVLSKDFLFKVFDPSRRVIMIVVIVSFFITVAIFIISCFFCIRFTKKTSKITETDFGSMESIIYDTPSNYKRPKMHSEYASVSVLALQNSPAFSLRGNLTNHIYDRPNIV